ncbi:MAG: hypothetical protein ABSA10_02720, partial [Anaerolineales bacterium]
MTESISAWEISGEDIRICFGSNGEPPEVRNTFILSVNRQRIEIFGRHNNSIGQRRLRANL